MLVYDKAHELARALKQCEEYRTFTETQKKVMQDPEAKKMLEDFFARQWDVHRARMAGEPEDQEKIAQLQKMYEVLQGHTQIRDFFTAEMRFSRLMADIQKIIADAVTENMVFPGRTSHER